MHATSSIYQLIFNGTKSQKYVSGWDKGWPDKVVKYYFTNVLIPAYKSMIKNQTYLLSITTQWKEDSISGSLLHNVQFDEKKSQQKTSLKNVSMKSENCHTGNNYSPL